MQDQVFVQDAAHDIVRQRGQGPEHAWGHGRHRSLLRIGGVDGAEEFAGVVGPDRLADADGHPAVEDALEGAANLRREDVAALRPGAGPANARGQRFFGDPDFLRLRGDRQRRQAVLQLLAQRAVGRQ